MDIVDVSPPDALVRENPPVGRRSVVADSFGALLWLVSAVVLLLSCWLPLTNELNHYPAENGVPSGFIRLTADAWGRLRATHSAFEGVVLGGGAPRYGLWLAVCAAALVAAAVSSRWPRIVPAGRTIGGVALMLAGGAVLSIRVENLPREPIEADPGATWSFGSGLWLMTVALVVGAMAWARAHLRARPEIASSPRELGPSRWRTLDAVLGSVLAIALLVSAGFAHAFAIAVTGLDNGRIFHVRYSFDGWGRGVMTQSGQAGVAEPTAYYAPFSARDAIPVSLSCAVLLVAAFLAVRTRIDISNAVRVGGGAVVGGIVAIQLTVAMWMRHSLGSGGGRHFSMGPSTFFLLAAVAVTWTPWAWRAWDHRSPRPGHVEQSAGLDTLT